MDALLPPLGLKGRFTLKEPLNQLLNPNITYEVYGIEAISKLASDNIDVKTVLYVNQGLTIDDYVLDLENNTPIVTLITEGKQLYYIPSRFIVNMPEATGVVYKQKAIVINIGYVEDKLNVDFVLEEVVDLVNTLTGVKPSGEVETISGDYLLSYEDADVKEADRLKNITNNTTCGSKLKACYKTLEHYKVKIDALIERINLK